MKKNQASEVNKNEKTKKNENDTKNDKNQIIDFLKNEIVKRVKIDFAKERIIENIETQKDNYLDSIGKEQKDRLDDIKHDDALIEKALELGDMDELKKAFQTIIDKSKK